MQTSSRTTTDDGARRTPYTFRLTPAEWRQILADETFLYDPGNSYRPRRLMGVPVEIIPGHERSSRSWS
jgi:hypothetical protein